MFRNKILEANLIYVNTPSVETLNILVDDNDRNPCVSHRGNSLHPDSDIKDHYSCLFFCEFSHSLNKRVL